MVYDTQWKCDINKNVLKIILLMKEHNKKAKYVDVSILLVLPPPSPSPSPGDFCVGLGVQASKETATKLKFNKLLEPNYFGSLALNIFAQYYWHLSFFLFLVLS